MVRYNEEKSVITIVYVGSNEDHLALIKALIHMQGNQSKEDMLPPDLQMQVSRFIKDLLPDTILA